MPRRARRISLALDLTDMTIVRFGRIVPVQGEVLLLIGYSLYTISLMQTWDHAEFIMFGLDAGNTHALFSQLVRDK